MDDLEDIRVMVYGELSKIRKREIYYLFERMSRKYSIVDIEELVNQSILRASYNYNADKKASFMTYFKTILKNATINYLRDKGKYDLSSIDEIFENDEGDRTPEVFSGSNNQSFRVLIEKEENHDLETINKYISKFINEELEGIDKTVAMALLKIVYEGGDSNFQEIAEDCNIDKKRIYKIKEKIGKKFKDYIKKLPQSLRDIFREITFEPKPGEPTKFAYLIDSMPVAVYTDNEETSTFEKLVSLIFAYQNSKFNNFINNNIPDEQFKLIYNKLNKN